MLSVLLAKSLTYTSKTTKREFESYCCRKFDDKIITNFVAHSYFIIHIHIKVRNVTYINRLDRSYNATAFGVPAGIWDGGLLPFSDPKSRGTVSRLSRDSGDINFWCCCFCVLFRLLRMRESTKCMRDFAEGILKKIVSQYFI